MNWGCKFFPTRYCWYAGGSTRFYSARLHSDSKHEVTLVSLFKQPPWTPLGNFSLHIFAHHCFVPHKKRCCFNAFFLRQLMNETCERWEAAGEKKLTGGNGEKKQQKLVSQTSHRLSKLPWKKGLLTLVHISAVTSRLSGAGAFFFFWGSTTIYLFIFHFVAAAAETVNCHAAQIVWSRMCETEQ